MEFWQWPLVQTRNKMAKVLQVFLSVERPLSTSPYVQRVNMVFRFKPVHSNLSCVKWRCILPHLFRPLLDRLK
jgi:hypothetical protein